MRKTVGTLLAVIAIIGASITAKFYFRPEKKEPLRVREKYKKKWEVPDTLEEARKMYDDLLSKLIDIELQIEDAEFSDLRDLVEKKEQLNKKIKKIEELYTELTELEETEPEKGEPEPFPESWLK